MDSPPLERVLGPGLGFLGTLKHLLLERIRCLPTCLLERERDGECFFIDLGFDMGACLNTRVSKVRRRPVHLVVPVGAGVVQRPQRIQKHDRSSCRALCSVDTRSEGMPAGSCYSHGGGWLGEHVLDTRRLFHYLDVSPRRAIVLAQCCFGG